MLWSEFIQSMLGDKSAMLLSTATTGVNESDCLLAVSYVIAGTENSRVQTLFHNVPASCAQNGAQYHRITVHTLSQRGLTTNDFVQEVNQLFATNVPFSYNPSFQKMALNEMVDCDPCSVVDLPLLLKLARSHLPVSAEDLDSLFTFKQLEDFAHKKVGASPPFKSLMRMCNIVADPYTDELPVVTNVEILERFWEQLGELEMVTY